MSAAADADDGASAGEVPRRNAVVRTLEIVNKKGLHARPAAKFAQTVEQFDAEVRVSAVGGETIDGSSILDLLMLGAAPGCSITIEATGPEAEAVSDALTRLVSGGFGEED
jgi:phosphocarrier protein